MKMQSRRRELNNKGFSLLEVLIAMVILVIVSIPLIRSFVTSAMTNSKAKVLMRATDCAENMMENLEYMSLAELKARYEISSQNAVTVDADDKYTFVIRDVADMPVSLPDGYYIKLVADPGAYPNANALNLAEVKSMSIPDTAVYNMPVLYDESIYNIFRQWNYEANEDQGLFYQEAPTDYFKKSLTRSIDITIDKKGTGTDEAGKEVDLVAVNVSLHYYFASQGLYNNYLPPSQNEYVVAEKEIYNNVTTKKELENLFVFYQPRYLATVSGNKDKITIHNEGNVAANVFICAQVGVPDLEYKFQYYHELTGPDITIIENPSGAVSDADGAIRLFTNLSGNAPYSSIPTESGVVEDGKILCNLVYQNPAGTQKETGMNAVKILDGRDLDGKVLIGSNTKNRIYKVYVTIMSPDGADVDSDDDVLLELDGTKLE